MWSQQGQVCRSPHELASLGPDQRAWRAAADSVDNPEPDVHDRPVLAGKRPVAPRRIFTGQALYLRLFRYLKRIVDLDAEIAHGALQLCMS